MSLSNSIASIIVAAVTLVGCASKQVRYETVEVKVPLRVPCEVATPAQPTWLVKLVPREATVYEQMRALLADRELANAYMGELEVSLAACKR